QWLLDAHHDLDEAVAVAYGWQSDISEEEALSKLFELNLSRATSSNLEPAQKRAGRRPQSENPEQTRRSPQFKLPIAGGKPTPDSSSTALQRPTQQPKSKKGRLARIRNSA